MVKIVKLSGNEAGQTVDLPLHAAEAEAAMGTGRLADAAAAPAAPVEIAAPVHIGGGYYELADGSRVRGKVAALKATEALAGA